MPKARIESGHVIFRCPGCEHSHVINVNPASGRPCWGFNGDLERPTFTPSVLNRSGHHATGESAEACQYCKEAREGGYETYCSICHVFVTNGAIQFLSDCTHKLAGQTVPLPEIEATS